MDQPDQFAGQTATELGDLVERGVKGKGERLVINFRGNVAIATTLKLHERELEGGLERRLVQPSSSNAPLSDR